MKKAVLLYNPESGGIGSRQAELESIVALLRGEHVEADLVLTHSPDDAQQQAVYATQAGCDTVFACGGDGTIHSIAQGMVNSSTALAILPMGTANALAHDLGLPMNLPGAARAVLRGIPRRVAVGRIEYVDLKGNPAFRYFVVAAGAGVDAHLFYKLHTGTKQRMGMAAYYAKAWHLWFSYPMTRFRVKYMESEASQLKNADVTELLAVRIRHFGGVVQEFAPGASLDRNDMRLILCQTSSRLAYLAYVTRSFLRRPWAIPGIELGHGVRASCEYSEVSSVTSETRAKIYVEADGELLGSLPAEITVVPDALTLLAPAR